jgi:hypothetical protein
LVASKRFGKLSSIKKVSDLISFPLAVCGNEIERAFVIRKFINSPSTKILSKRTQEINVMKLMAMDRGAETDQPTTERKKRTKRKKKKREKKNNNQKIPF